ncbi:AsmA family protein [Aquabacterium sp.]|uniref:AsmA family protein n=1 Tax=Aquabacterium sp. TaxID=1872578 RepID=UPI0019B382C4|nr:AsmA family protein [Aquabacterium sp.]MBC7702229.1 AsmA family protein [Aquabacterium sp.]
MMIKQGKKGTLLALGILTAIMATVAVCEYQGWPFLKGPLERTLSQKLQRRIVLGDQFALHLLGAIRLRTSALTIGSPGSAPDLLNAVNPRLEVPYSTVFGLMRSGPHEPIRITSLELDRMDAALSRDAQGQANWQFSPRSAKTTDSPGLGLPRFDRLVVKAGRLQMQDALMKLNLDAQVSTAEGDQAQGTSGLLINGKGHYLKRPFELHIKSSGVLPLAASPGPAVAVPITVEASAGQSRLRFNGQAADVLTLSDLDGSMTLSGPSLAAVGDAAGVTLPTTTLFSLKGQLSRKGDVWSLKQTNLNVGTSQLGGSFTFDRRPKVPMLTGEVTGSRFVLSDLAPAFGAQAPGANNPAPPEGRMVPQRTFDIPSLHAMNADIKVRLKRVELGALFDRPLEPLDGQLRLKSGVLTISDLLASTADGQVSGRVSLNGNPKPASWDADVHWKGIRLEQWLSPRNQFAGQGEPDKGKQNRYVTGQLGGHAKLHGQGNSAAQMLGTMDGDAQAWVQDGTISHLVVEAIGLDVAQALGVAVIGDDLMPMHCAAVRVKAQRGALKPEVGVIDTEDSTILVSGSLSLVDESLNLVMTAKPKDISPLTLRSPLKVQGTFADPKFRLEAKPLGLKIISAVALGFVNPLASIIPLIDLGDKTDGGCQQALAKLRGDRPNTKVTKVARP